MELAEIQNKLKDNFVDEYLGRVYQPDHFTEKWIIYRGHNFGHSEIHVYPIDQNGNVDFSKRRNFNRPPDAMQFIRENSEQLPVRYIPSLTRQKLGL